MRITIFLESGNITVLLRGQLAEIPILRYCFSSWPIKTFGTVRGAMTVGHNALV